MKGAFSQGPRRAQRGLPRVRLASLPQVPRSGVEYSLSAQPQAAQVIPFASGRRCRVRPQKCH